jgi:4-hydroxy-tetrahydrodipicolinate synthase
MQMLLATLTLGGSGATMPPPAAEIARQVIDAFSAGDYLRAAQIQLQFALFPSRWMHRGLTATMKTAMGLIGMPVGSLYPPYVSLDAAETAALADFLKTTVLAKRLIQYAHA